MKALRAMLDRVGRPFEKGGRLERWYPLWEAMDTFFYTPAKVTATGKPTCATRSTSSA
jgi:Na+-transporting NADH:ubiquinone oxidoreductase subunit B